MFANCPNVQSFLGTFAECSNLTGNSIRLWEEGRIGIDESNGGIGCYANCEKLTDYSKIPIIWKLSPTSPPPPRPPQ